MPSRQRWLQYAMQSWRQQTYRHKELLIISESGADRRSLPDDVRYVEIAPGSTIGAKRNLGCELAHGEIICTWDDDDYSAPGRIVDQVERILKTGKPVTGYNPMRFTDGRTWWQYRNGHEHYGVGTSLTYRKDWWRVNRFPSLQLGEDNVFVAEARARGAIVSVDAGDLMFATIHSGNTSPRSLTGASWRRL